MSNIAIALKQEITRLSRKEVRTQVGGIRKSALQHRHHIALLRQQVAVLRKQVANLTRRVGDPRVLEAGPPQVKARFIAKGLPSLRRRLGLSAADLAKLVDVSAQSVYNWEHQITKPRPAQVAALASLRKLGKRQISARLSDSTRIKK